ncbi:MAG: hypothetical protein KAS94_00125 [Desulfobulbaceae bacterium]|nr:hypothetical protein [Desulfobulbaceae bacterium]
MPVTAVRPFLGKWCSGGLAETKEVLGQIVARVLILFVGGHDGSQKRDCGPGRQGGTR